MNDIAFVLILWMMCFEYFSTMKQPKLQKLLLSCAPMCLLVE